MFFLWWWRFLVKTLVLQWHLNETCNLKCLHCYQEKEKEGSLEFSKLKHIYEQYKELLKKLNYQGHINLTGGEPLCNPYFYQVLEMIQKDSDFISFSILSNGTLITEETAKKIGKYHPKYVQVSLEGGKKINDFIRGKGTYKKIAEGIKNLKKEHIFVSLSFTATKVNYKEFPKVVKYAKKYHVDNVWSDRYIPLGDGEDKNLALNKNQTREYFERMKKEQEKLKKSDSTTISMKRALQFQMTNDFAYGCTAGDTLLTVMANGDLVPCRRMPIVLGNLLNDSMISLYEQNPILKQLREKKIPDDCKHCEHSNTCRGGLKCLTYALYKNWNHKDIGCPL